MVINKPGLLKNKGTYVLNVFVEYCIEHICAENSRILLI